MKHVRFYGASDDLIEVEGNVPGADEYNADRATFAIAGLRVTVAYDTFWSVTVRQIHEDVPVTAVNARLTAEGYTMVLSMEVPDGAYISRVAADA